MSHLPVLPRHDVGTNGRMPIMTDKVGLFAAAPSLMKTWFGASATNNAGLDPSLAALVKIRSLRRSPDAPTASEVLLSRRLSDRRRRPRRCSAGFRAAASKAHAHRLSHAGLRGRRRGR